MKIMRILLTVLLVMSITKDSYAGGGWLSKKQEGYFKLSENVIRSPHFYSKSGELVDIPTISLYTTSLYVEYGLSDRWNAVAYVPFFVRSTLNKQVLRQSQETVPGDELSAFGDMELGIRYGLVQDKPVVAAASATVGVPSGSSEVTSKHILQTGDGEMNLLLRVDVGHSIKGTPLYLNGYSGINLRSNDFSEEFRYGGEVGAVWGHHSFILKAVGIKSFKNGNGGADGAMGVFGNNIEYFVLQPEVNIGVGEKVGISASGAFALTGYNILAAPNYSLGFYYLL